MKTSGCPDEMMPEINGFELCRKIKEITNLNPNELINIARLKKAEELLTIGQHKVYEIAEIVGYNSQTTFGRNFQK